MIDLRKKFPLSAEEAELLMEFESQPSLTELAKQIGRDHSIVARMLKRVSEKFPVVEKKAGKWTLTDMGRQLNNCTRSAIAQQAAILSAHSILRIGTNREFSSRILAPDFATLQKLFPNTELHINSYEAGSEQALLGGLIDIGIDCDRPYDPEIAYKLVVAEPIVAVASKAFAKKYKTEITKGEYIGLPHLMCERLHPDKILFKSDNQMQVLGRFNDIASTRAACSGGVGWALLPRYAVADELNEGSLIQIDKELFGKSKYGVWWPRRRAYLKDAAESLIEWLSKKDL